MRNDTYIHYKNGRRYIVIFLGKIQENNCWVEAVTYREDRGEDLYTCSLSEFQAKFKKVNH